LPPLASNHHPPDLCLLSSWDYRRAPPVPGQRFGVLLAWLPSFFGAMFSFLWLRGWMWRFFPQEHSHWWEFFPVASGLPVTLALSFLFNCFCVHFPVNCKEFHLDSRPALRVGGWILGSSQRVSVEQQMTARDRWSPALRVLCDCEPPPCLSGPLFFSPSSNV
jgi:hypothetical protein